MNPDEQTLLEHGKPLHSAPRAFDILVVALIEHSGETIRKDERIARAPPDAVAEEVALRVHLAALRKALGGSRELAQRSLDAAVSQALGLERLKQLLWLVGVGRSDYCALPMNESTFGAMPILRGAPANQN